MREEEPGPRATSHGMTGRYGQRYPWLYWLAVVGAFVLGVLDIAGDGPEWASTGAVVLIVIAILVRPGGIRGPNRGG